MWVFSRNSTLNGKRSLLIFKKTLLAIMSFNSARTRISQRLRGQSTLRTSQLELFFFSRDPDPENFVKRDLQFTCMIDTFCVLCVSITKWLDDWTSSLAHRRAELYCERRGKLVGVTRKASLLALHVSMSHSYMHRLFKKEKKLHVQQR
jgi:hypothetical protein